MLAHKSGAGDGVWNNSACGYPCGIYDTLLLIILCRFVSPLPPTSLGSTCFFCFSFHKTRFKDCSELFCKEVPWLEYCALGMVGNTDYDAAAVVVVLGLIGVKRLIFILTPRQRRVTTQLLSCRFLTFCCCCFRFSFVLH